jgi:phage terminase large subunit
LSELIIPAYGWKPRTSQKPLWNAFMASDFRDFRGSLVAHRRQGKDTISLQLTLQSMLARPGTYWHLLPAYNQARKAIWTAINPHTGRRIIDEVFPHEIRAKTREQEMAVFLKNGAVWQVMGSDNTDTLVGSPPLGLVFSEYALSNPRAFGYLSPIIAENHGWALFITTPRGRNHAWKTHEMALANPRWYAETIPCDKNPDFNMAIVDDARVEYTAIYGKEIAESLIQQEYYCSFQAPVIGAYYASQMDELDKNGHVNDNIKLNPDFPVQIAWDIGISDMMALTIFQVYPDRIHIIDYYESSGKGFAHYVDWLNDRGYSGGTDWVPHDAKKRDFDSSGDVKTRIDHLLALKRNPVLVSDQSVADGINAVRLTLPRCYFNRTNCARLIECLQHYQTEWDDKSSVFKNTPAHDWSSHAADSFRYFAVAVKRPYIPKIEVPKENKPLNQMTFDDLLDSEQYYRKIEERC